MAKRILIADDSVTMQKAFAMTFAAEGVTVVAARSSDEGLTLARQARPDLVIADIAMPGRSGYELCQSIKSDPALGGVPVFILGSLHTPVDEGRVRQCGADGHTLKPFDSTAMIQFVLDALARTPTSASFESFAEPFAAAAELHDVPEFTVDADSATLRVPADEADVDDYGEIAIEDSGGSPAPDAVVGAAPPVAAAAAPEDVVTPPPEALPIALARPQVAPAVVVQPAAPAAPALLFPPVHAAPAQAGTANAGLTSTAPGPTSGGMRPSLIPGLKPGAVPAGGGRAPLPGATVGPAVMRPPAAVPTAASPAKPNPMTSAAPVAARGPAPPVPAATPASARTLVGLPAVTAQPPPRPAGMPTRPVAMAGAASSALPRVTEGPARPAPSTGASVSAVVASRVEQKMAEIAARGPEYEAIAKLSREIIEKVVWEVVPQLAEAIVREELAKRGRL